MSDRKEFQPARDAFKAMHHEQRLARARERECPGCGQDGTGLENHVIGCPGLPGTVMVVHHHDIEKHAEHFNEGFDEAHRQGVGGEASRNWLTEKIQPLLKDHVDPENVYHLTDHIADALLSEADLGEQRLENATYTAVEVKALTKTAADLAYALGRKETAEEIAAALEAIPGEVYPEDVFPPDGTSVDCQSARVMRHAYPNAARIARDIAKGDPT